MLKFQPECSEANEKSKRSLQVWVFPLQACLKSIASTPCLSQLLEEEGSMSELFQERPLAGTTFASPEVRSASKMSLPSPQQEEIQDTFLELSISWLQLHESVVVGSRVVGSGVIGSGVVGSGVVGSEVVGSGVVGSGVIGSGVVGSGVVGFGVVGSGVVGSGVVGSGVVGFGVVGSIKYSSMVSEISLLCSSVRRGVQC